MGSNKRDRPYNGKPHTYFGVRGMEEVTGLTMRDISDCMAQGLLVASGNADLQHKVCEIGGGIKDTKCANKSTWRQADIYKVSDVNYGAVIQSTLCFIEHFMGIYPNVKKTKGKNSDV